MTHDNIKAMAEFTDLLDAQPTKAYDFICNESHRFTKDDLVNIIKELIYSTHYHTFHDWADEIYAKIMRDVAIELDEQYDEAYQETEEQIESNYCMITKSVKEGLHIVL